MAAAQATQISNAVPRNPALLRDTLTFSYRQKGAIALIRPPDGRFVRFIRHAYGFRGVFFAVRVLSAAARFFDPGCGYFQPQPGSSIPAWRSSRFEASRPREARRPARPHLPRPAEYGLLHSFPIRLQWARTPPAALRRTQLAVPG